MSKRKQIDMLDTTLICLEAKPNQVKGSAWLPRTILWIMKMIDPKIIRVNDPVQRPYNWQLSIWIPMAFGFEPWIGRGKFLSRLSVRNFDM
ncbi:hypothetical protein [Paracoccus aeridis]|uniref:hypothetical protein n=1 Tax=Paracoccus aeridis TaxID=1966466 RepID=UPI0010A9DF47|nr:hypothetical protein [Paracoccus aeridis]